MHFPENSTTRKVESLWLFGLVVASLLLYSQSFGLQFVDFDDENILTNRPHRYDETSLLNSVRQIFLEDFPREEPLVVRDSSWALDARLFGFTNPRGYHGTNIVLNALVVGLLFLFLRRLRLSASLAGGIALVFATLPVHVEPVAWVMGRKDLLVAAFSLVALLAQQAELSATSRGRKSIAYAITLGCVALALGSKISAISLWLVLALHRFFFPYLMAERQPDQAFEWRRDLWRTAPAVMPQLILSLVVVSWYRARLREFGIIETGGPTPLDPTHLINIVKFLPLIAGEYLRHLFLPGDLSIYYRWPHVAIPLTRMQEFASIAWTLGIAGGIGYALRQRRDLVFHPLMALVLLAPYTGFFYVGLWHADRYFYLASAEVLTVAAIVLRDLVARRPRLRIPVAFASLIFVVVGSVRTFDAQPRWHDSQSLWSYEASREEPAFLSFAPLAQRYAEKAEAAPPEERRILGLRSKAVVALAFERYEELGLVETRYPTPERDQLARLHDLAGRADSILGAPPLVVADHYRRAYALAQEKLSALLLSKALYEAARNLPLEEAQPLIEESFDYLLKFVAESTSDPALLRNSQLMIDAKYSHFPYLEPRIALARKTYFD